MSFLSWRDDYLVGVTQIDMEHQYLFGLINQFHDRYRSGGERKDVLAVLSSLVAYAEEHFQHEEALMARIGYPQLAPHHEQHEKLFCYIFELFQKLEKGALSGEAEMLLFLRKWLLEHILQTDMDIGRFLNRRPHGNSDAGEKPPENPAEKAPSTPEPAEAVH